MSVHARHKKNEVTRSTLKSSGITTTDKAGESRKRSQIREVAVQYYSIVTSSRTRHIFVRMRGAYIFCFKAVVNRKYPRIPVFHYFR